MNEGSAKRVVWIVGAGSGIGRATALAVVAAGWTAVLSGRRADALAETARSSADPDLLTLPLDARDRASTTEAAARILERDGRLDALVVAAGLNSPQRSWADQDLDGIAAIIDTNLLGPTLAIGAALPALRASGGVVVLVSSYSAWAYNPVAGVAYSASKSGLSALARTLNSQEGDHGVRACHLCPGDVDTDFLNQRPSEPTAEARSAMLSPADVARSILFVLDSPAHVRIDELVVSPVSQR